MLLEGLFGHLRRHVINEDDEDHRLRYRMYSKNEPSLGYPTHSQCLVGGYRDSIDLALWNSGQLEQVTGHGLVEVSHAVLLGVGRLLGDPLHQSSLPHMLIDGILNPGRNDYVSGSDDSSRRPFRQQDVLPSDQIRPS